MCNKRNKCIVTYEISAIMTCIGCVSLADEHQVLSTDDDSGLTENLEECQEIFPETELVRITC